MAQPSPASPRSPAAATPGPAVRLEARSGGRTTVYEVGDGGFLVGSVPGCDLRLPGSSLPPVLCLIARHPTGASLRRLAPVQPIVVNGQSIGAAYLANGDRISLGNVELIVSIQGPVTPVPVAAAGQQEELRKQAEQIEAERQLWTKQRADLEVECRQKAELLQQVTRRLQEQELELAGSRSSLEAREEACRAAQEEMSEQLAELARQAEQAQRDQEEVRGLRQELMEIRQQLYQRYHQRRDRLIAQQQAVRRAAGNIRDRKHRVDAAEVAVRALQEELAQKQAEIEGRSEQLERERQMLDDQHRLVASRQQEAQRDLQDRLHDIETREKKLVEAEVLLVQGQKQHQADLVRLDRIQAHLEQRQKQLRADALQVDRRYEGLQRDLRDLEEQAAQLDAWHNRLVADTEALAEQKKEQDRAQSQLEQRTAALEGQQAMLATLRTRFERMREELHRQEQGLSDQRAMFEATETDLRTRSEELERLRSELQTDRQLHDEERRRFAERQELMDAAVAQMRQAQEVLTAEQQQLQEQQEQVEAIIAEQVEQTALVSARSAQLDEQQQRLEAEREELRQREQALARAEQGVAALQEQLRRRSEELNDRHRSHSEEEQRLQEEIAHLEECRKQLEQDRQLAVERLDLSRKELAGQAQALEERQQHLDAQETRLQTEKQHLEESLLSLNGQRQVLASERIAWEVERQKGHDDAARRQAEIEALHNQMLELARQMPELESRSAAALERLVQGREQLREHLTQLHDYSRQGREDMETAQRSFQAEVERVRQQELSLQVVRDEHRLAVAAFRQQIVEWQGTVGELKLLLQQGQMQLDRRRAEVHEEAQQVASRSAQLAQQAESLQVQQQLVAERRGEVDRHLLDMREWYRRKLREVAGLEQTAPGGSEGTVVSLPAEGSSDASAEGGILSLIGDLEPGDRHLGELLRSLDLVDSDTLSALLLESRRRRRTLRQVLLAGGYLTLYQIALIEAGNLDGLVLGPVRVIDRLQATPREAVFRVFDPRRSQEALLRHLAESEMHDAIRPDEFRQRFAAALAVRHPHVAATLEVLEINSRPAVLQEWLHGLPGTEWPALAGVPGVWLRLLTQAALALQAVHDAGLAHGHLHAASFLLTAEGTLKLTGLGEPRWLAVPPPQEEGGELGPAHDLAALGHIAAGWAANAPTGKSGKVKAPPSGVQALLMQLQAEQPEHRFGSATELLQAIEGVGRVTPDNPAAWDRFVRQVREEASAADLRESA